jgi:PHD/YefM family antitoxin component YafN of YafNO toxin-antitoxin module
MTPEAALAEFLAWLETDYLAPIRAQIVADTDTDLARGHVGSYT